MLGNFLVLSLQAGLLQILLGFICFLQMQLESGGVKYWPGGFLDETAFLFFDMKKALFHAVLHWFLHCC